MPKQLSSFPKEDFLVLSDKEMEGLLFMMDDPDLVKSLVRFPPRLISAALARLVPIIEKRRLPVRLVGVDLAIIKCAIEDSDWPANYVLYGPTEGHIEEARATLRQLARRVVPLGIEVDRIAYA